MASWQPPSDFRTRPVAVLGAGVLGRRIAACWVAGGWTVRIRDPSEKQRLDAEQYVLENIGAYTTLTQRDRGQLETCTELPETVKDAWLVIEAVPEKLALKETTFAELEQHAPEDCILASNSSSYKSSELVGRIQPQTKTRVLNTHYMMPPQSLIVELMTDGHTADGIFPFLADRHREAGLHPVVALKESTGFVFNRIWASIKREVLKVLLEGVSTPDVVDSVFKEMYGARMGPCRMMDNVGLDTVSFIEEHYVKERGLERQHLDWLESRYVNEGKLGAKTAGKGGLFSAPKPGEQTKLLFLNLGLGEPLDDKLSFEEVLHRGSILSFVPEEGGQPKEILTHEFMPDGLDVADGRIYWTDMGNPSANDGALYSATLDGQDIQTVVSPGQVHTPKQCVIDQDAKKLYFCDREGFRVMRVNLDGTGLETLVQTADWQTEKKDETYSCVGIAISRKLGKIFWTQKGPSKGMQGRIFSAGIDLKGQDPSKRTDVQLIQGNLPEPIDMEFDDESGVLYWTDRGELPLGNTLNKKTLIGDVPASEKKLGRQILAQGFSEAIGLRLDKVHDCVWVADLGGHIWKCNPHRPSLKEKVYEGETGAFTGLALIRV